MCRSGNGFPMPSVGERPANRPTADELARLLEPLVDALPAPRLGRFRPSPRRRTHDKEVHL